MATKMKMRAVFDCSADDAGELSFKEGDILVDVVNSSEEGWYSGRLENTSTFGLFPFNYVERIYDSTESTPEQVTDTPESISPKNLNSSSKWSTGNKSAQSRSIVTDDNSSNSTILPAFPALDAFEAAMSGKGAKPTTIINGNSNLPPIISPKPKLTAGSFNNNNVQGLGIKPITPVIAEKPQLKNLNINGDASPTRIRAYSASSALNKDETNKTLRPSQLAQGKGTKSALELALTKGSPVTNPKVQSKLRSNSFSKQNNNPGGIIGGGIPLVGMANLKLNGSVSHDVEEEDGFQMIKPSQLRQRQQQQQSSPRPIVSKSSATLSSFTSKPTVASWKNSYESGNKLNVLKNSPKSSTSSKLGDVPVSTSPMPRLPTRPVSNASRKSRNSRENSLNSSPVDTPATTNQTTLPPLKEVTHDRATPPILKPKPVMAQPNIPRRPSNKTRSTSNPPPLQPKPATMSSIEVLLNKNKSQETNIPPRVSSAKPTVLPYQPKSQLNKSNLSSSTGATNNFDKWRSNDSNGSVDSNITPSALFNRARSSTNPTDWSNSMTKRNNNTPDIARSIDSKPEIKKKATPPPPPPSRPPKSSNANNKPNNNFTMDEASKHRYEILFDTIHDDGYVDGETARFIWLKSKLSSEELSRIWKECDPDHKGLLDKHAFIDGMGRIDELLIHKQQQVVL